VVRERKYVVAGALLSLLFTLALVSHFSDAESLLAFSRPADNVVTPVSEFGGQAAAGESDGLERFLGPQSPSQEEGFT
jgi:hypothetical protein